MRVYRRRCVAVETRRHFCGWVDDVDTNLGTMFIVIVPRLFFPVLCVDGDDCR